MTNDEWSSAVIDIGVPRWMLRRPTRSGRQYHLIVVHTVAGCYRALPVVDHVESDPPVQPVRTGWANAVNHRAPYPRRRGALVPPGRRPTRHRLNPAVAAAGHRLRQPHPPVTLTAHHAGMPQRQCPGALPVAVVAGDPPSWLTASLRWRAALRRQPAVHR